MPPLDVFHAIMVLRVVRDVARRLAVRVQLRRAILGESETVHERDMEAAEEARESGEITIHDWSDEERAKFRAIARSQWEKAAEASENSQKVYDTLTTYLVDKGLMAEE